jgi:hypothetical protein
MAKANQRHAGVTSFRSIGQSEVPQGRNGKHKPIVSRIVADLEQLPPGRALRIPLAELPDSKANIRSALNRVTRQRHMQVSTSSDELHLYVWQSQAR